MNRHMNLLAFLLVIALIACVTGFIAIVFVDRYHRAHPPIEAHLPNSYQEIKTPPSLILPSTTGHDVKG